jgi:hypothetical protein
VVRRAELLDAAPPQTNDNHTTVVDFHF